MDGDVWHLVEGRRDDGAPAIFRIRELAPRLELPRIFVVEMPYPITEMSRLPNAAAYRRLAQFEEQWIAPACTATGYEQVGLKIEEGSFFLYMYGATEPQGLIARLAPFDAALGFYDDEDPLWGEYATLKDLLDQAKAMPFEARPDTTLRPSRAAVTVPPTNKPAATSKPPAVKQAARRTTKLKKTSTRGAAKKGRTKPGGASPARRKQTAAAKRARTARPKPRANKPAKTKKR